MSPSIYAKWEAVFPSTTPFHSMFVAGRGGRRFFKSALKNWGPRETTHGRLGWGGVESTQNLNLCHPDFLTRFLTCYCPGSFSESLISKVFLFLIHLTNIDWVPIVCLALFGALGINNILVSDLFADLWIQDMALLLLDCPSAITHILSWSRYLCGHWLDWPLVKPWFGGLRRPTYLPTSPLYGFCRPGTFPSFTPMSWH